MFEDREELMRRGIVITYGGCGNAKNRVSVGMSPQTPAAIAFMKSRYDGPIDYEAAVGFALREFEPPDIEAVWLAASVQNGDPGLSTCSRRPFAAAAIESASTDINANGSEFAALREALSIYLDVYGEMAGLGGILAERELAIGPPPKY